jgi:hypothetical protein
MIEKTRIIIAVFAFLSWLSTPISAVTQSFSANQVNNEGKKAYDTLVAAKRQDALRSSRGSGERHG